MLVLTRKPGESLRIGDKTKITVINIEKNQVELSVNGSERVTINLQESISIRDDITVKVVKINKSQVKLGINAPESMKVDREGVAGG